MLVLLCGASSADPGDLGECPPAESTAADSLIQKRKFSPAAAAIELADEVEKKLQDKAIAVEFANEVERRMKAQIESHEQWQPLKRDRNAQDPELTEATLGEADAGDFEETSESSGAFPSPLPLFKPAHIQESNGSQKQKDAKKEDKEEKEENFSSMPKELPKEQKGTEKKEEKKKHEDAKKEEHPKEGKSDIEKDVEKDIKKAEVEDMEKDTEKILKDIKKETEKKTEKKEGDAKEHKKKDAEEEEHTEKSNKTAEKNEEAEENITTTSAPNRFKEKEFDKHMKEAQKGKAQASVLSLASLALTALLLQTSQLS